MVIVFVRQNNTVDLWKLIERKDTRRIHAILQSVSLAEFFA